MEPVGQSGKEDRSEISLKEAILLSSIEVDQPHDPSSGASFSGLPLPGLPLPEIPLHKTPTVDQVENHRSASFRLNAPRARDPLGERAKPSTPEFTLRTKNRHEHLMSILQHVKKTNFRKNVNFAILPHVVGKMTTGPGSPGPLPASTIALLEPFGGTVVSNLDTNYPSCEISMTLTSTKDIKLLTIVKCYEALLKKIHLPVSSLFARSSFLRKINLPSKDCTRTGRNKVLTTKDNKTSCILDPGIQNLFTLTTKCPTKKATRDIHRLLKRSEIELQRHMANRRVIIPRRTFQSKKFEKSVCPPIEVLAAIKQSESAPNAEFHQNDRNFSVFSVYRGKAFQTDRYFLVQVQQ
ncbi:unnamed protein product [Nesidiocoris tenuis]|uniref:Uncharacterized protein n=1 Tax=Nesidiocoris tenuis TaxID=355587 RepID=A0A6H5FXC0_9HEMI|nr:unnamed protein product [Nesidiocoris tenuis]